MPTVRLPLICAASALLPICLGESESWHVVVDAFEIPGSRPSFRATYQQLRRVAADPPFERFEGFPILHHDGCSPEPTFHLAQAQIFVVFELLEHSPHGTGNGPPLMNFPEFVDSHTDQEDDEFVFRDVGGDALGNDGVGFIAHQRLCAR